MKLFVVEKDGSVESKKGKFYGLNVYNESEKKVADKFIDISKDEIEKAKKIGGILTMYMYNTNQKKMIRVTEDDFNKYYYIDDATQQELNNRAKKGFVIMGKGILWLYLRALLARCGKKKGTTKYNLFSIKKARVYCIYGIALNEKMANELLPALVKEYKVNLVRADGENANRVGEITNEEYGKVLQDISDQVECYYNDYTLPSDQENSILTILNLIKQCGKKYKIDIESEVV